MSTKNIPSDLKTGELALNITEKSLYSVDEHGNPIKLTTIVQNVLNSESQEDALSALQGKILYDYIYELQDATFPVEIEVIVTPKLVRVGDKNDILTTCSVKRKGQDIISDCENMAVNGEPCPSGTKNYGETVFEIATTQEYKWTFKYEGKDYSKSVSIRSSYDNYFGLVPPDFECSEENIKAKCSKVLIGNKGYQTPKFDLKIQKTLYAYPSAFGELTSILDGNGYELIDSYERREATINGQNYYIYILKTEITNTQVIQIYK